MEFLKAPSELDLSTTDSISIQEKWRKWRQAMELYLQFSMSEKTEKERCGAFLYLIGQSGRDVYNTMTITNAEKDKLDVLFAKFEEYCNSKQNVTMERYKFNTRNQGKEETVNQYVVVLKLLAKNCKFGILEDEMIRDRLVCGITSERVKGRLLRERELSLDKAMLICQIEEESNKQMKLLSEEGPETVVQVVKRTPHYEKPVRSKPLDKEERKHVSQQSCGNCGFTHHRSQCPALGKKCYQCGRLNHFSHMCRSKKVATVHHSEDEEESEEAKYVGGITKRGKDDGSEYFTTLIMNGAQVKFKVDTGSQVNILPWDTFKQLHNKPRLNTVKTNLVSYSGDKLTVVGTCQLRCKNSSLEFFVVKTKQCPILSFQASKELDLIRVITSITRTADLIKTYEAVFQGLGCLTEPYNIRIDHDVQPVVCPLRNQPVALRERLKEELDNMERMGVIKKVEIPTDWVNSLVIVEKHKTKQLRICLDPRPLNKAIKREHFQLPTLEDITTRLSGAKRFSKLDAKNGYWQIPLGEESQLLTTFSTPFGRYCFARMPFGVKSAQEVFQKRMCQCFGDLPGVEIDIDDILVWGASEEEHNSRLQAVLQRCKDIGLTLNKDKCKFNVSEVTYLGHTISANGVAPDKEKVRAIAEMPPPDDKKGVERLLGVVNYVGKFIPNMAAVTKPIRELLKKEVQFNWSHEHEEAFKQLKHLLSTAPVLAFYDVKKSVTVSCDASQFGLGAVLLQEGQPIAYASRSLTDTECRYAQIEKELLAVVFGLEKFNQYVYGKCVDVESDHKPLEAISKKSLCHAPPRLQRMLLRLQRYDFTLRYKPGKEMVIADTLSRACTTDDTTDRMEEELKCAVHLILSTGMSEMWLQEIKEATNEDQSMQKLKIYIQHGWPEELSRVPEEIREYWHLRDQLSEADGILLKGEKLIIPQNLRGSMLDRIHMGHMGVTKCSQRAREVMFWPGMNKAIEQMVLRCTICQEHRDSNPKEPMLPGPAPERPWEIIATDLFQWDGKDYVLLVDYYSRYIEIRMLENTTSTTMIHHIKSIFSRHGIPSMIISDNGPQYTAKEFQKFTKEWRIRHVTASPYHPQANGLAEKSVQTVKRILSKAKADGQDLYLCLLEYRNTMIDNLASPAQLLMGRRLRTNLPVATSQLQPKVIDPNMVKAKQNERKAHQKQNYDKGSRQLPELKKGERARVQIQGKWKPVVIMDKAGTPRSYIVKTEEGKLLRRNRKYLMRLEEHVTEPELQVTYAQPEERHMEHSEGDGAEIEDGKPAEVEIAEDENTRDDDQPGNEELAQQNIEYTTRSGRVVKPPKRFNDFVKV